MTVSRRYVWIAAALAGVLLVFLFFWEGAREDVSQRGFPPKGENKVESQSSSLSGRLHSKDREDPMLAIEDCPTCPGRKQYPPGSKDEIWSQCYDLLYEAARNGNPQPNLTHLEDCDGETPLHYAKTPDEIRRLVEAGANPNAQDSFGRTPLHILASDLVDPFAISALLEAGADPTLKSNRGLTPLGYMNELSGGETEYKMQDISEAALREMGVDMDAVYEREPELRPEIALMNDIDRKREIERLLLPAMGVERPTVEDVKTFLENR